MVSVRFTSLKNVSQLSLRLLLFVSPPSNNWANSFIFFFENFYSNYRLNNLLSAKACMQTYLFIEAVEKISFIYNSPF